MSRTRHGKLATLDFVEEVARRIPGYRGYAETSLCRDDDRRFCTNVAEYLRGEAHRLENLEGRQFRDDLSDLLEEVDGGARKLEYLADAVGHPSGNGRRYPEDAAQSLGRIDHKIVERIERLHGIVHELEKAYSHDEQFELNLAELRGLTESIAELIEERNLTLSA